MFAATQPVVALADAALLPGGVPAAEPRLKKRKRKKVRAGTPRKKATPKKRTRTTTTAAATGVGTKTSSASNKLRKSASASANRRRNACATANSSAPRKFVCGACRKATDTREVAQRCAAWHTGRVGADPYCMRYPLIYANLQRRVRGKAPVRCADCEHFPHVAAFNAAVEVNESSVLQKNLMEWFGSAVVAPQPPP